MYDWTLQPDQSGGVGSSPGRAPPLECHDKGSQTRLALRYFCDPSIEILKTPLHRNIQNTEPFESTIYAEHF